MPEFDLQTQKQSEEIKARLRAPALVKLDEESTLNKLLPSSPEEGPPLPRMLGIKWPWVKREK